MADLHFIQAAAREKRIDYRHYTLARFINDTIAGASDFCCWLCVLVDMELSKGNVCLNVDIIKPRSLELGWPVDFEDQDLQQLLESSPLVAESGEDAVLIYQRGKLYLNRYFQYENTIAETLRYKAVLTDNVTGQEFFAIRQMMKQGQLAEQQALAMFMVLKRCFTIISGGPGTGKTWTVARILKLLLHRDPDIKIALAAPTGKAAARVTSSLQGALQQQANSIESAKTLHRLLGLHRYRHRPSYHQENPLDIDVLVVDEASMIDQHMMALLCNALPPACRLILLGDKDQLSSVEAGSVFADLCGQLSSTRFSTDQRSEVGQGLGMNLDTRQSDYPLANNVVVLDQSHRFDPDAGIGQIASLTNKGDADACIQRLQASADDPRLNWYQYSQDKIDEAIEALTKQYYLPLIKTDSVADAFDSFQRFRILTPVWQGITGVDHINDYIEAVLRRMTGINPDREYFTGKPLIMESNLPQYDIHNGDIGILWPDQAGRLQVWFERGDGSHRPLSIAQCPKHRSAFAMTVHKSQGSEFNKVLLIMPYQEREVCTRELLYTAITRASESIEIWSSEAIIRFSIEHPTQRVSGLLERLNEALPMT